MSAPDWNNCDASVQSHRVPGSTIYKLLSLVTCKVAPRRAAPLMQLANQLERNFTSFFGSFKTFQFSIRLFTQRSASAKTKLRKILSLRWRRTRSTRKNNNWKLPATFSKATQSRENSIFPVALVKASQARLISYQKSTWAGSFVLDWVKSSFHPSGDEFLPDFSLMDEALASTSFLTPGKCCTRKKKTQSPYR